MQLELINIRIRRTRGLGFSCLLVILFLFLGQSAPAFADEYKTHYDLALALYQAQRFDDSIPEFKAAYDLIPKPGLLFNIAQAYRKAGHPREAIEYYDRYLSVEPQLDGDTRHKVDSYLMEARNTLAALELEMKRRLAEEKAARDSEPPAPAPAPAPTPAPTSLQPVTQSVTPSPVATVPPAKPPIYKRWWFWTAIGGAVAAGVIVGVAVGVSNRPQMPTVPSGVPLGTITF